MYLLSSSSDVKHQAKSFLLFWKIIYQYLCFENPGLINFNQNLPLKESPQVFPSPGKYNGFWGDQGFKRFKNRSNIFEKCP